MILNCEYKSILIDRKKQNCRGKQADRHRDRDRQAGQGSFCHETVFSLPTCLRELCSWKCTQLANQTFSLARSVFTRTTRMKMIKGTSKEMQTTIEGNIIQKSESEPYQKMQFYAILKIYEKGNRKL